MYTAQSHAKSQTTKVTFRSTSIQFSFVGSECKHKRELPSHLKSLSEHNSLRFFLSVEGCICVCVSRNTLHAFHSSWQSKRAKLLSKYFFCVTFCQRKIYKHTQEYAHTHTNTTPIHHFTFSQLTVIS